MRSTHAAKIKFNKNVLWTLSFEIVEKKFVFQFVSVENEFFSRVVHRPAREPNAALDLARDYTVRGKMVQGTLLPHTVAAANWLS